MWYVRLVQLIATHMTKNNKVSNFISGEELRYLSRANDLRAVLSLIFNWGLIVAAFLMVIVWPNLISVIASILIIAGRQLGLSILLHDCAHHAFFTRKSVNNFVGHWLCGGPMNVSLFKYRDYHLQHHRHAGTEKDPDRIFVANYPVPKGSLKRKLTRDLTGQTGIRDLSRALKRFSLAENHPWVIFHIALLGTLLVFKAGWAYLLWWVAELFIFPALMRIRQIAEHGVVVERDSLDPRENTSTTLASWWERLLVAPNYVNYHLEHHQFAAVPAYNLPRLHKLLNSRGFHQGFDCISPGYIEVLRRAVQPGDAKPVR